MGTHSVKTSDRDLGMHHSISRRDFLNGMGALAAGSLLPGRALAEKAQALELAFGSHASQAGYPPALTGLRGAAPGSFTVAHQLALQGQRDWGRSGEPDPDIYDLVIVGGGISGLASAYFYRKRHPDARILILDNNDDFGGHARRNEFEIGDRTIVGYGGSQSIQSPTRWPKAAKDLLDDLGFDASRFKSAYDQDFYRRNGLSAGIYFDRENYGVDRIVPYEFGNTYYYLPLATSKLSTAEAVARMPISKAARREMRRLLEARKDQLPDHSILEESDYLSSISYRDFLVKHLDIHQPEQRLPRAGLAGKQYRPRAGSPHGFVLARKHAYRFQ